MNTEPLWTERTARQELTARPLTFGDEKQIRAHRFLEQLELARESYEACRECHSDTVVTCGNCDGEGYTPDDCFNCDGSGCEECEAGVICRDCDATGKTFSFDESCACIAIYKQEVIDALKVSVENVRPR